MNSYGVTSLTNCAPTRSHGGRPCTKSSSITHCRNVSEHTGQPSSMPYASRDGEHLQACHRCYPVDHCIRKACIRFDPASQNGSRWSANSSTARRSTLPLCWMLSQLNAVNAGRSPASMQQKRFDDDSDCAVRQLGVGKVACDRRVAEVQLLRCGIQAVAIFGDRQADDPNEGTIDRVQECRGIVGRVNESRDRADDRNVLSLSAAFHQRVKTVLRRQAASWIFRSPGSNPAPTMPHARAAGRMSIRSCV